jgi:hypothetical protein
MQLKIVNMMGPHTDGEVVIENTQFSFRPFLNYVRGRLKDEASVKKDLLNFLLEKFKQFPELEGDVDLQDIDKYKPLFDIIHAVLSNVTEDEQHVNWGICVPMTPVLIYGSNNFYKIVDDAIAFENNEGIGKEELEAFIKRKVFLFYSIILQRFYGIDFSTQNDMTRNIRDYDSGLVRHYHLRVNTDFVEVTPTREIPELDVKLLESFLQPENAIDYLTGLLPVDLFSFRGFSVITVTDVTQEYAMNSIRDQIVKGRLGDEGATFAAAAQSLREMANCSHIEFNILPVYRINGQLVKELDNYCHSILFSTGGSESLSGQVCMSMIEKFIAEPRHVFFPDLETNAPSSKPIADIFLKEGLKSYSLFPVYYKKNLVGVIEAYSRKKGVLTPKKFALLEPAKEIMGQLLQNSIDAFDVEIENIIKEKFTSLQPSVYWKFNEVAWEYLQSKNKDPQTQEPGKIIFDEVYPLYGGVDIRNSTLERNEARHRDLKIQFEILLGVLDDLKEETGFMLLNEKIYEARKWLDLLDPNSSLFNQQAKLDDFLNNDILPFLKQFTDKQPVAYAIAEKYFTAIDENNGVAHAHKQSLEHSMMKVISYVNNYMTGFKDEVQNAYPCYFEKFRTDGVEYDIYIGQAITPDRPYSPIYLKNLRLMQLTSMAAIAKATHAMLPQLTTPVETTQLIFIHSNPITIRFRRDEKRFDVEGAYNIRYHIIKKRIDKVRLKDSEERLTQPNKIALVYFTQKEADEYAEYISYLQNENILNNDLEQLELEELQGVAGLKALRVGVNVEEGMLNTFFETKHQKVQHQ